MLPINYAYYVCIGCLWVYLFIFTLSRLFQRRCKHWIDCTVACFVVPMFTEVVGLAYSRLINSVNKEQHRKGMKERETNWNEETKKEKNGQDG